MPKTCCAMRDKALSMRMECRKLSYSRMENHPNASVLLDNVTVKFPEAGITWIQGPNGCGKSTLIHLLAGLLRPVSGEILADGKAVSRWVGVHRDLWRRQVGVVFQADRLLQGLTVTENILLPLVPRMRSFEPALLKTHNLLEQLHLSQLAHRDIEQLSGGERQRVNVARALVSQPRLILADEPTAHQDEEGRKLIFSLLKQAVNEGVTVILTSHDEKTSEEIPSDLRCRLSDGHLEPVR